MTKEAGSIHGQLGLVELLIGNEIIRPAKTAYLMGAVSLLQAVSAACSP